ncbi:hypothetical protein LPJ66_000228 [Kickxella alabastrina]|uniref:Uncharacterized protein n=1 Tax=Kickxella alabastrina TaxID=61397 RepID=A0ACC1IWM9_9FUNG|nr:hypothetical protein LPJ66_000228 [Kickxella alabastrina]
MDNSRYPGLRDAIISEVGGIDSAVGLLVARFEDFASAQGKDRRQTATSPSGVILSGIPGSGKTRLALQFSQSTGLQFETVSCPDLFFADQGKSEARLIECFADTGGTTASPGTLKVLVLEDIDVLSGSKRPDTVEARMFSLLLDCIDTSDGVFVVGTTSMLTAIPEEIKRSGRLDTTIDTHLADVAARSAVLQIMLRKFPNAPSAEDIDRIAKTAHGFSAADLQSLCLRTFMDHKDATTADDLVRMASEVKPSNLSSLQSKIPRVLFSDIFGLDEIVRRVQSLVVDPLMHGEKYREMQVEPPRGALIYGPPGSGKSMLCCAVANELAVNTIWVDASQMRSMIVGESEKAIADLFSQARKSAPCILLFDHIDALAPKRGTSQTTENTSDRIVTSLLVEMDGFNANSGVQPFSPGVFVLAVTSRPHVVDSALLRPGRLDVRIGLGVPDAKQREAILVGYMAKTQTTADVRTNDAFIGMLVERTHGYTGADIANLCREAALTALRRDIGAEMVTGADFLKCLDAGLR